MLSHRVSPNFYGKFYRIFKLNISLNLKQYYNLCINERIVKSFKESIELLSNLLYLYLLVFYISFIQIAKEIFQFAKKA